MWIEITANWLICLTKNHKPMKNKLHLKMLSICFDLPIRYEQLSEFRGAVINLTRTKNDLFHNHSEHGVIYRYPLVQYKKLGGKAALLCMADGIEAIHDFFNGFHGQIRLGNTDLELKVDQIKANQFNVGVWDSQFEYLLSNWLPLNQENYQRYQAAETFAAKVQILENALVGNLFTFCEGVGMKPEKNIKAAITRIVSEKRITYRGTRMQAYDIDFRTNLSLPNLIGLGKGSGLGFGVVTMKRKKTEKKD